MSVHSKSNINKNTPQDIQSDVSVERDPLAFLQAMYQDALRAADPHICLPPHLEDINPKGRLIVLGAGKAASSMVQAVEKTWPDRDIEGLVVTRYGYDLPSEKIEIVQASHPVPDEAGETACQRILDVLDGVTEDDFVLFLVSGGGSALLTAPVPALSSEEKREINKALLKSGARIHEMNCVRKHLSRVKGGQLALAAHPAQSRTLVISDVPGDDLDVIASGPTVPDNSTQKDALEIIDNYNIEISAAVRDWLSDPENETPKPDNKLFENHEVRIIASAQQMLSRAQKFAAEHAVRTHVLGDKIEGEARSLAEEHVAQATTEAVQGKPFLLLSGGEATVTIKNENGKGGPNTEYMLSALLETLNAHTEHQVYGLACDSDGIDGSEDNAGAYFTPQIRKRGIELRPMLHTSLDENDSYTAFEKLDALYITGPTYTNVNDFRAILVV